MKILAIFLAIASSSIAAGQERLIYEEIPLNENGEIEFTEVIEVENKPSVEVLYSRAREWYTSYFVSADDVIQMDDINSGKIIGRAFSKITIGSSFPLEVKLHYRVSVLMKEGRYKYVIDDLEYQAYPTSANGYSSERTNAKITIIDYLFKKNGKPRSINSEYKKETLVSVYSLIESLKKAMRNDEVDDDW